MTDYITKEEQIEHLKDETHRYQRALAQSEAKRFDMERELGKLKALCWRAADSMEALMAETNDPGTEALSVHYMLQAHGDGTRKPKFLIPFFEVWVMPDGSSDINEIIEQEMWGVGNIYGYNFISIEQVLESGDLAECLKENVSFNFPKNCKQAICRVTNLNHNHAEKDGYYTTMPEHWDMDIKVVGYECWSAEELAEMENLDEMSEDFAQKVMDDEIDA